MKDELSSVAKRISTNQQWNDLVLNSRTLKEVESIKKSIAVNTSKKTNVKSGIRILFEGPSGTGKTLTATLIGKELNLEVFRIDLSTIVSKYIGETEKNLADLFESAESKNWILFFDEADALFGKRTNVRDAHDKYANQEVSYLLQRIENYNGITILASNKKSNIDEAFLRRLHASIHFPLPEEKERLLLWQRALSSSINKKDLQLEQIASKYSLSAGAIARVAQDKEIVKHANPSQQAIIDAIKRLQ